MYYIIVITSLLCILGQNDAMRSNFKGSNIVSNKICETPSCVRTAATVLKNMNRDVDPCDSFYDFACGGFEKYTIVPEDKSSVSTYGLTRDLAENQLYTVLQQPFSADTLEAFKKIQKYYISCLDLSNIEKRGMKPLQDLLKEFEGWPVVEGSKWNEADFDWQKTIFQYRKRGLGISYFIDISLSADLKNTSKRIIELDQAGIGISVEYFEQGINHTVVKAYMQYMVDLAVKLGADQKTAEKELQESFALEQKLASISLKNTQRRNASLLYNPMTIAELQVRYPYLNWLDYINSVLGGNVTVDNSEIVIVNVPSYLEKLGGIIDGTPKRTIANYFMFRVTSSVIPYLGKAFRDLQLKFSSASSGKTSRSPRWKECIEKTSSRFGVGIGSIYVRNFFDQEGKAEALNMVKNLRSTFEKMLAEVDWMDHETKMKALDKAKAITNHIAYPDELLDDTKIEKYYAEVIPDDQFFEYNLNLNVFAYDFIINRFRQPVNKTEWITHGRASVVNAFYSPSENSIQFPAAVFQGMFFAKDRPRYMNYGCIGFTIGHEITHGFDDHGRQFDKDGTLLEWWDPATKEAFIKKAQCIVDQYSNFTVPIMNSTTGKLEPTHLNGFTSQGENIADNGGMIQAYYAYLSWAKNTNIEEPRLPGLHYTPRQMYWISAANKWCSTYKTQLLEYLVLNDPHVPGRFRINGPMSNLKEFSEDFHCPVGSNMNPEKKCAVW